MREIKFRLWDGYRMTCSGIMFNNTTWAIESVNEHPIMQYTGLKDKNGVETYHKDIVSALGYEWIIEWHGNGWKLKQINRENYQDIPNDFIIFANAYENPELIEEKGGE